jgi:hypothetical protein
MIKKRSLSENNYALSVMYDAVFFIVLVSLSGAVLLPAMMNPTAVQSSVERHREQLVDETLLMLMTSREPSFEYTFAQTQLESWLGILYNYSLINNTIYNILGKQQQHKTYADLCAENMLSQFQVGQHRLNPFTQIYDNTLETHISSIILDHTGHKYNFNLTLLWRPIKGFSLGGQLYIGDKPPQKNIYVANSFITLPQTNLSNWLKKTQEYIDAVIINDAHIQNISVYLQNFDEQNKSIVKENLTRVINNTFNRVLFDGVNQEVIAGELYSLESLIKTIVNFYYGEIIASIQNIIDTALDEINNFINIFSIDLTQEITSKLLDVIFQAFNINDFTDLSDCIADFAVGDTELFLGPYIDSFVDSYLQTLHPDTFTVEKVSMDIVGFLYQRTSVLRADIRLSIWEK